MRSKQKNLRGVGNVLLCLVFAAGPASAATEVYMAIDGSRQGQFKGESLRQIGGTNWIPLQKITFVNGIPKTQFAKGSPGRLELHQVRIVKHAGAASRQIWRAMGDKEVLRRVVIEFVHRGSNGAEQVERTITLRDVTVSTAAHKLNHVDEMTFTYRALVMDSKSR